MTASWCTLPATQQCSRGQLQALVSPFQQIPYIPQPVKCVWICKGGRTVHPHECNGLPLGILHISLYCQCAGGNYIIPDSGTYSLQAGAVSSVSGPAVMVVSDLDGTMVGQDHATGLFKGYWEDTAVLRGSVLVYNTGR